MKAKSEQECVDPGRVREEPGGRADATRMTSLYQQLVAISAEIANHYSDLYVRYTPEVGKLVRRSGLAYSCFTNQVEGGCWIDVPFAYDPFWEGKKGRVPA